MTSSREHIRLALPEDLTVAAQIYNHYLGTATLHLEPLDPGFFQNLVNDNRLWVMESSYGVIAWGAIKPYSEKEGYRYACETSTFFHPEFTGRGFGTIFKKYLMDQCREMGYRYILARIMSRNKRSIQYNLNLGYRIVGEQHKIGWINGESVDVTIMEYVIDDFLDK